MSIKIKVALLAVLAALVLYVYTLSNGREANASVAKTAIQVVESEMPQVTATGELHGWQVMEGEPVVFAFPPLGEGSRRSLPDYNGQIVVLNFWGSWCQPCLTEMPMLQAVADTYSEQGVAVVGVAVDQLAAARSAIAQLDIKYENLLGDGDGDVMEVISQYGNTDRHMPFTVIFLRDGTLKYAYVGELTREMLDNILKDVIKSEPKVH